MTPRCQYDHRGYDPHWQPGMLTILPPPALRPVLNAVPRLIAWQCPVCLRCWPAFIPRAKAGTPGLEIAPVVTRERRQRMIESLEVKP